MLLTNSRNDSILPAMLGDADDPHHFDFDSDRNILTQVVEKLGASPLLQLTKGVGPAHSGIDALFFNDKVVHIGKASEGNSPSSSPKCSSHRPR
jgi:hypothetical protein